ncbi:hypothetical protein HADU_03928 [Acinetobacter sp. HA]|uniref:PLxRFG domain-containing protein n=1 Tax=Acinetobacter sp. HA TaxID=1173062 RepID=UPI000263DE0E|nr:PLxRFG domain-containing protein [Acinetobacter sp. HA]EIM39976.1 hypothetical protein HADU_03928 [Acinetobacter sp. HA]
MPEQKKPWEQNWNQPTETPSNTQNKKPWEQNWNGNPEPEGEKSKGFGGHIRDIGASLAAGAASLPDVAIGIGDILTGGAVGKTVEDSGLYTPGSGREYWADKKTDQAKAQSQKFSDAEGIIDKTKVALTNPTLITNTVAESLPTMVAGGLVGRGLSTATKGAISPMVGGAIGEGTMMAGSQAENIRQQTDDGLLTGNQVAASVATGALGTLFGLAGGAVAKKFGFGDIDSMLAGANAQQVAGEIAKVPLKQVPKHVVLGALSEGLLEELPQSSQEQVLQNYALNKDLMDGVDDAIVMGALAGMTMGGAASGLNVQGHNQRYNAQEQLKVEQQAAQQAQEAQAMRDAQSQLFSGDVPDPVLDPSKLNPFSDNAPLTNPIIDMNRLEAADGNPRYDNGINFQAPNIETPLSLAEQSQTQAENGIDFERPEQGPTDLERQIQFNNTFGLETPDPVVDYNGISPFDNNPQKPVIDPQKVDLTPSQQMGLDPNLGPLSAAAATAVDGGMSAQLEQAQTITPEQVREQSRQSTYSPELAAAVERVKQRQQGEQNAPLTIDESTQNGTAQPGNAPLNNGGQSVSEQHDTTTTLQVADGTGTISEGSQLSQANTGQGSTRANFLSTDIKAADSTPGLTDTQQIAAQQLSQVDSDIATVKQQLQIEKSVPKKMQMRKQLESLQTQRTEIETQHKNIERQTKIENAAHEAASSPLNDLPEPTQAQIEAGNYKKGHIKVHGLDIAVENPRGSERRGTDPDGKEWAHEMSDHYGYIKSSIGADNEAIDTYIGRNPESEQVFIVDQIDQKTGGFDEHKVMMGFNSQEEAIQAYSSNFDKGWKVGPVRAMNKDEFKSWLKDGDTKKPAGESAVPQSEATLDPQSIQRDYGDSLESVMSDVETLADDFTIDLHSVPKKRNALKNPNYHAVQHENGRVEILGMKHPATGEWVGKAPTGDKTPAQDSPAQAQEQIKDIKSNSPEKPDSSSKAQSPNLQIQSDSGLTHSIPSKLMDQVHKLGDVVSDLASMKTEGVKTNVLYGKQLLAKIAKLNPNVQVHIVSNLDNIQDKATRARLSSGGFYIPDQNILYIYPQTDFWEGSVLELLNHELTHTVTEQSITTKQVSRENLDKLEEFRSILGEYIWNQGENLDANMAERLRYAYEQDFPHELLAVSTAESNVREVFKKMLGENGFKQLDAIFTEISTNQFKEKQDDRLSPRGQSQQSRRDRTESLSTSDTRTKNSDGANAESSDGIASSTSNKSSGTQKSSTRASQTHVSDGTHSNNGRKSVFKDSGRDHGKTLEGISEEDKQLDKTEKTETVQRLYSRAQDNVQSGQTPEQVREALVKRFGEKTISSLERRGLLDIISTVDEPGVEGFYQNGRVTLVASNLNETSIIPTFLHELGGHGGFQNVMSEEKYADLMGIFNDMVQRKHPLALEAKRLAERETDAKTQQLEYLPYLLTLTSTQQEMNALQKSAIKRFIDKVVSAVKAWAFDRLGINLNLNENDMVALANRMIQQQIAEPTSVENVRAQLQGTDQWMKAPNGKPTNLTEQQWLQVRTPEFKQWFGDWENSPETASKVVDENGEPQVVYHGTSSQFTRFKLGGGLLGRGVYLTDRFEEAQNYAGSRSQDNEGTVMPLFANIREMFNSNSKTTREQIVDAMQDGFSGIRHQFNDMDYLVAFNPEQVKSAVGNTGLFSSQDTDIRFSRQANAQQIIQNLVSNMNKQGRNKLKTEAGYKATHALQYVLGALGRRQLTELYQKLLPQLKPYNDMVAMMDADQNEVAALSDDLARRWADLKDEKELANVMHDATLAKIDPAKPYQPGDNVAEYAKLKKQFDALSGDAKKVYREARDAYKKHHRDVRQAIQDRILRSSMSNQKKTELLQQMDANFFGYTQGVYFPLQRFGKYVVLVRDAKDQVISVSRAETLSEAHKLREILQSDYPNAKVHKPMLDKEYDAARDGVGRGFMTNLFNELGSFGLNAQRQAELEDILGQLYLKSLPDLSYAKHSVHRKGTAGFSQDARRAFAQNMFHGGSYLAKLRYKDQLEEMLDGMQKHATEQAKIDDDYEQPVAQQVIDEMNKRHKNMMEANSHPLSTALTSLGFLYYLGLSPASAAVNTLQTVLVAYPQMGAKWGYDKAGAALAKASDDFRKGVSFNNSWNPKNWENDIAKILKGDELKAYEEAVRRGVIDVTMAHDLAGIAQGEDSGVMWKLRPVMRWASALFHNAERFNREVTFIAAYRLARDSGSMHDQAFEQAMDSTYKGHFDYSSGNRPRIMQGNIAKVILLFKQFGQNMIYTLARTAHQSLKGETPEARREAQRALAGIIGMHTVFAGVMGLPLVGPILAMASMLGSDDDEPWDAEVALRNWLADTFGQKTSEVLMKGASRFGPADLSGRVGINNLLLPDVQDGLEGKDFSDAMVMSGLGPVVGILTNTFKGLAELADGHGRGIETMSPVFPRSIIRSIRYGLYGAQDKTGVMIKDDIGFAGLVSQAVGFSPSEVRLATEGRSAIYSHTKRLDKRRTELMNDYVRAVQRDDMDDQKEIWAEIQAFNQKNPSRRISRVQAMQSLRQREKRVKQAEHGIYLPNKKREDVDIGRFAFDE